MNYSVVKFLLIASIIGITLFVIQPKEKKAYSQQEVETISKTFANKFNHDRNRAATKETSKAHKNQEPEMTADQQSILAVIYKKPETTWFFKAKDSVKNINKISASFKNYFIDQLKFDQHQQPILSHIPESMATTSQSSMRVATFMIEDVEISVSQLSGQQDTFANIKRWMGQIGLDDNAPIHLDFQDDRKTIIVKLPK